MPEPERLVATLHIYEGLSIREAASRLQLAYPEASRVWRRVSMALKTIPAPTRPMIHHGWMSGPQRRLRPPVVANNPSTLYVDAVSRYARTIRRDPDGLYLLYSWPAG